MGAQSEDAATVALQQAQADYLREALPDAVIRPVAWSAGKTQVIEVGAGPPVLLLHGGLGDAFQWAPLMARLSGRWRLLAVDRPGHGLADPFDHRAEPLLTTARRFVGEVLNSQGLGEVRVVANSMGGLWASAFALEHPERVERLVLVGSPAGIARPIPPMLRLGMLPGLNRVVRAAMAKPTAKSVRGFWKLLVAHPERLPDSLVAASVASQARNHRSWFGLLDASVDAGGMRPEVMLEDGWSRLQPPTTFIWGDRDAWADIRHAEAIVAASPGAKLVRISGAGHGPWFDEPEATARAVAAALG